MRCSLFRNCHGHSPKIPWEIFSSRISCFRWSWAFGMPKAPIGASRALKANRCSTRLGLASRSRKDRKSFVRAVVSQGRPVDRGAGATKSFTEIPVLPVFAGSIMDPGGTGRRLRPSPPGGRLFGGRANRRGTKAEKRRQSGGDGGVYIGRRRTLVR